MAQNLYVDVVLLHPYANVLKTLAASDSVSESPAYIRPKFLPQAFHPLLLHSYHPYFLPG